MHSSYSCEQLQNSSLPLEVHNSIHSNSFGKSTYPRKKVSDDSIFKATVHKCEHESEQHASVFASIPAHNRVDE